ncbi:unnamed protein product [Anisakis simplex]|uniref:Uncharacterized protein n=1 Tax=Anisakis simplex TaxID=6269 RepID=A0A0M3J8H9_ANISI|nr:unnamed protein product [Anisakis simplex]
MGVYRGRSTQGVTREQLRAASASVLFRDGKENDHRNRWSSSRERERELSKTPSQESLKSGDSQASTVNSTEVVDEQHDKKPTSTTVTASSYPTKDMANLRRRSQISRSTRRGTGPISFEEVQSALDAISTPPKDQSQQQVTEGVSSLNAPSTSYTNTSATAASTLASAKNQSSSVPSSASTANSNAITRVMITERDKSLQPSQVSK